MEFSFDLIVESIVQQLNGSKKNDLRAQIQIRTFQTDLKKKKKEEEKKITYESLTYHSWISLFHKMVIH